MALNYKKLNFFRTKRVSYLALVIAAMTLTFLTIDFYVTAMISVFCLCRVIIFFYERHLSSSSRSRIRVNRINSETESFLRMKGADFERIQMHEIRTGDDLLCEAGSVIPADGEIIDGMALVDESAVTGESAPVMRGGQPERSYCTAGSYVISNRLLIRVTQRPQDAVSKRINSLTSFSDREITEYENKISKTTLLMTCTFLLTILAAFEFHGDRKIYERDFDFLATFAIFAVSVAPILVLPKLQSILSVIFMDGLLRKNLILRNAEVLDRAQNVTILFREENIFKAPDLKVVNLFPLAQIKIEELASAAQLASISDDSAIGRSIVIFAKDKFELRAEILKNKFVQFSKLEKYLSGIQIFDEEGERVRSILKGEPKAIENHITRLGAIVPRELKSIVDIISDLGGVPVVVCDGAHILGVIQIQNMPENDQIRDFVDLGIETVILAHESLTPKNGEILDRQKNTAVIAAHKLHLVRSYQSETGNVAVIGSKESDGPALAEADLSIALGSGSQILRHSADVLSLTDSLTRIEQLFTAAHKIRKVRSDVIFMVLVGAAPIWFAILPGVLLPSSLFLSSRLTNPLHLHSMRSAILSAALTLFLLLISQIYFLNSVRSEDVSRSDSRLMSRRLFFFISLISSISVLKILDLLFS